MKSEQTSHSRKLVTQQKQWSWETIRLPSLVLWTYCGLWVTREHMTIVCSIGLRKKNLYISPSGLKALCWLKEAWFLDFCTLLLLNISPIPYPRPQWRSQWFSSLWYFIFTFTLNILKKILVCLTHNPYVSIKRAIRESRPYVYNGNFSFVIILLLWLI